MGVAIGKVLMRQPPIRLLIWDHDRQRAESIKEQVSSAVLRAEVRTEPSFRGEMLDGYNLTLVCDEKLAGGLISSIVAATHLRRARIIMFRDKPSVANIVQSMAAGADSYLAFPVSRQDFVLALDGISRRLRARGNRAAHALHFSDRETELLDAFASEHSVLEIAEMLGLSPHTIKAYRRKMRGKMIGWLNGPIDD